MKIFNRYNSKPLNQGISFIGHDEVANQQMADECEVRTLLNRYSAGVIDELPVAREAVYNDQFITPQSYEQAKKMIDKVKMDFYSLPVEQQRQFGDLQTYVKDIYDMSQGKADTIAKYQRIQVAQQQQQVADVSPAVAGIDLTDSSGSPSSSLSRSDTNNG